MAAVSIIDSCKRCGETVKSPAVGEEQVVNFSVHQTFIGLLGGINLPLRGWWTCGGEAGQKYCFALGDICGSMQRKSTTSHKLQNNKHKKSINAISTCLRTGQLRTTHLSRAFVALTQCCMRQCGLPCCPGPVWLAVAVSGIL